MLTSWFLLKYFLASGKILILNLIFFFHYTNLETLEVTTTPQLTCGGASAGVEEGMACLFISIPIKCLCYCEDKGMGAHPGLHFPNNREFKIVHGVQIDWMVPSV